jgi:hypothetical protein
MNFLNEPNRSDSGSYRHNAPDTPLAAACEFYYDLKPSWGAQQEESFSTRDSVHSPPLRTLDGGYTVVDPLSSMATGPGYMHMLSHGREDPLSRCANSKEYQSAINGYVSLPGPDVPKGHPISPMVPMLDNAPSFGGALVRLPYPPIQNRESSSGAALMSRQSSKREWPCFSPNARCPPATCSIVADAFSRMRAVVSILHGTIFDGFDART